MSKPTREAAAHADEGTSLGLERLVFFSDAVIAIAITLLVLDIRLPDLAIRSAPEMGRALLPLVPKILSWAVSFWVIALYWVAHHRCFRYIQRYNRQLMFLNFLFLMFVAFMPFPTSLLFNNSLLTPPVVLYAATAAGMGFSLAGLWIYAVRHRFIGADTSPRLVNDIRLNLILPPIVFVVSMIVGLYRPGWAPFVWLLQLPYYIIRRSREHLLYE
jgi:uncharacterized membrane protein